MSAAAAVRWAVLVVHLNGSTEFVKAGAGDRIATFSKRDAKEHAGFMREGMEGDVQSINVVRAPAPWEPKWVEFQERVVPLRAGQEAKTRRWDVVPKGGASGCIGWVKWYGGWRKYVFYPLANITFDSICLRDIATFCDLRTQEHRAKKAA